MEKMMRWTRLLSLFVLLSLRLAALAACTGAPAPQTSGATTAPAASSSAPTSETAPTAIVAATTVPVPTTAAAPTTQQSAFSDHPDGTKQARLRLAYFVFGGPNVDLLVNGAVAVNGGQAQVNIPGGYVNGYLYLAPGTYRVAVVPSGKGLDQALGGALEAPLVAGHRYTLAMIGQLQDNSVKPLLIDETDAEMKIGAKPTDAVRITVNNLAGVTGLDAEWGGKLISKNIPYGGFDAGIYYYNAKSVRA